jgi:probable HAF family extracellular repeat protein
MATLESGHFSTRRLVLAGVMLGLFACAPDQEPTGPGESANLSEATSTAYQAVFLPTLGGTSGDAADLNAADQIVGQTETSDGFFRATLWENRVPRDLGTLGGLHSRAYDISESGRIVGEAETSSGDPHAFLWTNGVMRDLGTLGGRHSAAHGINSAGVVVGWANLPEGPQHAFKWERGVMTDLGTLGGRGSAALGINSFGHIVGYAENAFAVTRAVLWKDGRKIVLPHLGGRYSQATAINDDGQIVGFSLTRDGRNHAALWENGTIRDLGVLPGDFESYAADINGAGQVVGHSDESNRVGSRTRAFWWIGGLRNLGPTAPIPHVAFGINKDGDIVGRSRHPTAEHQTRATLWTRE